MRGGALTIPADNRPSSPLPRHGNSPAPHNRALRQNQDSRSSVVRPLRRHSKSRPAHHRSRKDRKLSIATLGERATTAAEAVRLDHAKKQPQPKRHRLPSEKSARTLDGFARSLATSLEARAVPRSRLSPPSVAGAAKMRRSARRALLRATPGRLPALHASNPRAASCRTARDSRLLESSGSEPRAVIARTRRHRVIAAYGRAARGQSAVLRPIRPHRSHSKDRRTFASARYAE